MSTMPGGSRPAGTVLLLATGVLAVLVAVVVLGWTPHARPAPDAGPDAAPPTTGTTSEAQWLRVLRHWDRARAQAYATGDTRRLQSLYVPGSAAGVADLRLLHTWSHRGLRVSGMRTQVLAMTVPEESPDRVTLRVTDRVTGAVARGGGHPAVLPRDRASTRDVTLVRGGDGRWRVAEVRNSPGRSTTRG